MCGSEPDGAADDVVSDLFSELRGALA
jgi:hypothetical protein